MPLASLAANVTGTMPVTVPPPHAAPPTLVSVGATLSDNVTRAEYRSAFAAWIVPPVMQAIAPSRAGT